MTVGARAHEATAIRIFSELGVAPGHRAYGARATVQAGVVGGRCRGAPGPFAGLRRDEAHLEGPSAVPEAVDTPFEIRTGQLDPALHFLVGVGVVARRFEGDFLRLPDVDLPGLQPRVRIPHRREQQHRQEDHAESVSHVYARLPLLRVNRRGPAALKPRRTGRETP